MFASQGPRLAVMALVVGLTSGFASQGDLRAQERKDGVGLRVDLGYSTNHDNADQSVGGALRLTLPVSNLFRFDGGFIIGAPYGGLDIAFEVRFPERSPVKGFARAGGGILVEDGYTGEHLFAGAGVELSGSGGLAIRLSGQGGTHGSTAGPHMLMLGLEYRFRR